MAKESKYGELTKMVSYRIPLSLIPEINQMVKLRLLEAEKSHLIISEKVFLEKPIKSITENITGSRLIISDYVEKKSNPTNVAHKVPVEKFGETESTVIGVSKLSSISKDKKKVVDMDALREIASGKGLKGTFELTKKKVSIDEVYDFEVVKSLPSLDDQVYVDKKGFSCYDRYDVGIFYVKWEGRILRFDDKKEYERFAKEFLN